MIRSGVTALRLGGRSALIKHSLAVRREFTSKETAKRLTKDATRLAQDAGRIAQDGSKVLVRIWQEISVSNEAKLMRLTAMWAYERGKRLFAKHVVKNRRFQSLLMSLKAKLDQISTVPEVKQDVTQKGMASNSNKGASMKMEGKRSNEEARGTKQGDN